jgi:putative salt-induced outer membrane protein YdiY
LVDGAGGLKYIKVSGTANPTGEFIMKKTMIFLCAAGLCAAAAAVAEEVICREAKLAFEPPGGDWRVKTDYPYPVAASLGSNNLNGTITLTYKNFELYDFKIDYGFIKGQLEKNEKNTFKVTKPNYDRISLGDKRFTFGRAARLEFSTFDELGYHHTVVYAIANGPIVVFASAESLEREWPLVEKDFESLVASIRFTP